VLPSHLIGNNHGEMAVIKNLLMSLGLLAAAQCGHASDTPVWKDRADMLVSAISSDGPGVSVLVTERGKTIYESARGLASVELGAPITTRSVFRVGSITKTVTAAAILKLAAEGKLELDAPISNVLPRFGYASQITIRQLLSHTSGISDAWDAPLAEQMGADAQLARIGATPLDFAPGADWQYSNSGYMVLGAILEKITGVAWYQAEKNLVLSPTDATSMAYHDDVAVVPRLASGYTIDKAGNLAKPVLYSIAGPGAAGGLVSDTRGISQLLHGIAKLPEVGKNIFQQMSTPARIDSTELPYGMGLVPGRVQGEFMVEHSGGIEGYLAHFIYIPSGDIAVVILENSDAPSVSARSLAMKLAALALGKPYRAFPQSHWTQVQLEALVGTYLIPGGGAHHVVVRQHEAWIRQDDSPEKRLVTSVGDVLTYAGDGIDYIRAIRDPAGKVTAIDFHTGGAEIGRQELKREP